MSIDVFEMIVQAFVEKIRVVSRNFFLLKTNRGKQAIMASIWRFTTTTAVW